MPDTGPGPARRDPSIRIRAARAPDTARLAELEAAVFATDRLSRRSLQTLARRPSAILVVAERLGRILGYVLMLTRAGSRVARLYSIAVDPETSGRGVGALLLAAGEAAAARRGAETVRLEVRADNPTAIRMYEARGYVRLGRREDYYEDGAPALRYGRALARVAALHDPSRRAA